MQLQDSNIKITGSLTIKKYNSDNELTQELHVPNLIVNAGKQYIMSRMVGNTPNVVNIMAVGINGSVPSATDTALVTQIARSEIDSPVLSNPNLTIEYSALFDGNTRSGNIVEAGLFSSTTVSKSFNGSSNVAITNGSTVSDGSFVIGTSYTITTVGTTNWNTVAGTTGVSYVLGSHLIAKATSGGGNGAAQARFATITSTAHGFSTGDAIKYSNGGGTSIAPLVSGNTYYIVKITDNTFRLSTSYANATAATPIVIGNAVGSSVTQTASSFTLGSMLCRSTFPVVTKAVGDSISINWVVRIG